MQRRANAGDDENSRRGGIHAPALISTDTTERLSYDGILQGAAGAVDPKIKMETGVWR